MASKTTTILTCDGCGAATEFPQDWLTVTLTSKAKPVATLYSTYMDMMFGALGSRPAAPTAPAAPVVKHFCSCKCLRTFYKEPKPARVI